MYNNDLQNRNVSDDISGVETVWLFSLLVSRTALPTIVIAGRIVMLVGIKLVSTDLEEIFVTITNADAKKMLLLEESTNNYQNLSVDLQRSIDVSFYNTPLEAVEKAQGLE